MQGKEGDKDIDHQEEATGGPTEEDEQSMVADLQVIGANSNDNPLPEEIEVIEQVITKSEKAEGKKPKTPIKLPNDLDLSGPSCDKDVVGDDVSTTANHSTKGFEDSCCLSTELKPSADSTEHERIIREISSATTSSVIITPPARPSTISNDSVLEVNCNTSSENSANISETQQSGETNSSFVIEYAVSALNVTVSPKNNEVPEDGNLASLESLAKKDSFSSRRHYQSKASNETVTPTNSRSPALKSVKTDKFIRKSPLPKINPDASRLSRPVTAMAPKRDIKPSPNTLGNRNGVVRSTVSPKDKLPAMKRTVESSSTSRGYKIAQSSDHVRPYTSSSTYGKYSRKEISSSTQRAVVPGAKDKMSYRDGEGVLKRPSMIPKPRTTATNVQKYRASSKIDLQRKDKPSDYNLAPKIDPGRRVGYANAPPGAVSIHSRMGALQERLKTFTTMLKNRMDTNSVPLDHEDDAEKTSEPILPKTASVTLRDLYKNIFEMKETAMRLSDSTTMISQKEHIERLLMNITEIQRIADRLLDSETSTSKINEPDVTGSKDATIKSNKSKDNKIVIKFTQVKDKQKRKEDGEASNQSDEGARKASLKDTDSMDGIFIPSQEPFLHNIEEEEESNGLDITITFPELNHLLSEQNESHLSVRLSDISAEALRKLKRCPKDFTLRMDFVQGKVHFQSGKSPVNNFSIGPDLKFIEYPVDDKMSDIISIKPSTECSYGSQSTDSELFNVVNLPFLCRDAALGTVTRSCMTLRKERMMSMAIIARQVFKSMPQIPSLTYIQEENQLENGLRLAGSRKEKKKSCPPKKRDRVQCQQLAMIADEVE
nr:unnamed protein product [Callosobruchus analis]